MNTPVDVHAYYRQVTDVDIGEIARELLGGRISQESRQTLFCDCPNHRSQSHRSLHITLDKQGWYCFGCGVGGDVLQLVEFVQHGCVTRGQSGRMPESHRLARDFLAARVGLPPLSKIGRTPEEMVGAEEAHQLTLRVREALTAIAEMYHRRLTANPEVMTWFRGKYGIGEETIARLKIGYADNDEPSVARTLMDGPGAFTMRELAATSAFRPTAQDGIVPFFDRRIVFPYWSRGQVVFMIGRRTPWTPDQVWEKAKYKKLAVRNERDHSHVAPSIRNDVLYNEDVLLTCPERVVITEGVTDCISLMEHGFPAVSPVTVQIREADWERLLPKLRGVKTVYVCQDNEVSEAGMQGALKTARVLADHGIATRVAVLPLGEKQRAAREKLAAGSAGSEELLVDAKIDVNEFFASGKTAADFERILDAAQTPLELAISKLSPETPDADLARILEPLLAEVRRLDPIDQPRHLRLIHERCGKERAPLSALRQQMKVVRIDKGRNGKGRRNGGAHTPGPQPATAANGESAAWRDGLLLNLNGTVKPVLANAITALRGAPEWSGVLAYNEFAHFTVLQKPAPWMQPDTEVPADWTPNEDILTTEWLHHQGIFISVEVTGQAVETVAREHPFHPVRQYLKDLVWEGAHRLQSWLADFLGVDPSPYAAAVGSRWMISAVARVFEPGCKADCCLILEGEQGIRKSTALRVLAQPWFTDEIADLGSKDAALQTRGVWVIEIAELDSMSRSDIGKIKAFMSRATDRFRPPYGKRPIESPRQCVFAGSVNHGTYLRDETGGRRFWPVQCKAPVIDVDALAEVRDQLWAEATYLYFDGKPWWLDSVELTREATQEQADRYEGDPWDELILAWAESRESVSIADVLTLCLEKKKDQWTQLDKIRVARCLRAHGWKRFNSGPRGAREWRYERPK